MNYGAPRSTDSSLERHHQTTNLQSPNLNQHLNRNGSAESLQKTIGSQNGANAFHPGDVNLSGSYKNPWTTVSRPMNGFIDIRESEWEKSELQKQQLAADLRKQMEEATAKKQKAKQKILDEDLEIERKLVKEREEIKRREEWEDNRHKEKNENRRLAALALEEANQKKVEETKKKLADQERRR